MTKRIDPSGVGVQVPDAVTIHRRLPSGDVSQETVPIGLTRRHLAELPDILENPFFGRDEEGRLLAREAVVTRLVQALDTDIRLHSGQQWGLPDAELLDVERVIYELMGACSISTLGTDVQMTVEQEMPFIGVGHRDDGIYDIDRDGTVWTKAFGGPQHPDRIFWFKQSDWPLVFKVVADEVVADRFGHLFAPVQVYENRPVTAPAGDEPVEYGRIDLNDPRARERFVDSLYREGFPFDLDADPLLERRRVIQHLREVAMRLPHLLEQGGDEARDIADVAVDFSQVTEEPGHVVENLIPTGHWVLLVGDEGEGKSLLAEALAMHVETVEPFGGREVCGGPVLLLDGQLGEGRLRLRLFSVAQGLVRFHGVEGPAPERPEDLDGWLHPTVVDVQKHPVNVLTQEGRRQVIDWARQIVEEPVSLVIIDARDQLIGDADFNDARVAQTFHDFVRELQRELAGELDTPPAVLTVINLRKLVGGEGRKQLNFASQRVMGSGRWKDLADTILVVKAWRKEGSRRLERVTVWVAKDRDGVVEPLELDIVNDGDALAFVPANPDVVYLPKQGGRPSKLDAAKGVTMDALQDGQPHDWQEVIAHGKRQGIGVDTLRTTREELVREGRIGVWKEGNKMKLRSRAV